MLRLCACLPVALLIVSSPLAHAAPHKPDPVMFRLVDGGGETMEASIDGRAGAFLFDTGWGVTAVTPTVAAAIGCTPWGQLTGFRAIGERVDFPHCDRATLRVGRTDLSVPTLAVVDIMHYLASSPVTYTGAIGLDAFVGRTVTISLRRGELAIETPTSLRARLLHARPVPIRLVRDVEGAALTVNLGIPTARGSVWMELDTGNEGPTMVGRHIAALLGLDPKVEDPQAIHAEVVPGIELSGDAIVRDLIMDGDLSARFLERWDLTLDLQRNRAWLSHPNEGHRSNARPRRRLE